MSNLNPGAAGAEFRIGEVLSLSFQVLHKGLWKFLALSVLPVVPALAMGFGAAVDPQSAVAIGFVALLLFIIFGMIAQAALVYGALEELRGKGFTIADAFSKGFRRFWPVLGVAIVSGVIIIVGLLALLVPGFIALCMLYVAIPACVVEEWGVVQSLTRSADLTKGYRWPIFWLILLVIFGAPIASSLFVDMVQMIAGGVVASLLDMAIQIYLTALGSTLVAIIYYRLRVIKDGVDIDRIAHVFD